MSLFELSDFAASRSFESTPHTINCSILYDSQAKRKYDEAVASKRAIEAEHGEIREKYRQKAL